jgi:hypothetical protein
MYYFPPANLSLSLALQRDRKSKCSLSLFSGKENLLRSEIRPSPTGVAGAERIPPRGRRLVADNTWLETDIDGNVTRDRGPEADQQRRKETQVQQATHNSFGKVSTNHGLKLCFGSGSGPDPDLVGTEDPDSDPDRQK